MLRSRFILFLVRNSVASFRNPQPFRQSPWLISRNHRSSSTWVSTLRPKVHGSLPKPCWKLFLQKYHSLIQDYRPSNSSFMIRGILGLSVLTGSVNLRPQIGYCSNVDDHPVGMLDKFHPDEDRRALLSILRKLIVPIVLFTTVLMNWGHPIVIAAKVALILFTTKPSPLSVHLYVEELRHQSVWRLPFTYPFQRYFDEEVEVEDYMFLCLARVKLKGKKLALVGILGTWWALPLSWQEALSMSRISV